LSFFGLAAGLRRAGCGYYLTLSRLIFLKFWQITPPGGFVRTAFWNFFASRAIARLAEALVSGG